MQRSALLVLVLLGGCSSSWFVYDTDPVTTPAYRTASVIEPPAPPRAVAQVPSGKAVEPTVRAVMPQPVAQAAPSPVATAPTAAPQAVARAAPAEIARKPVTLPAAPRTAARPVPPVRYDAPNPNLYDASEGALGRMLSERPDDPYTLLALGSLMERTGRPFDASTYYRGAARFGETAPLGRETPGLDGTNARTVSDLARTAIARLAAK